MGCKNDWKRKAQKFLVIAPWIISEMDFNYKGLWLSCSVLTEFGLCVICYLFSPSWVPFTCLMQRKFYLLIKHF